MRPAPTLDQFREAVLSLHKEHYPAAVRQKYLKEFLESGEGEDFIKSEYDSWLHRFEDGNLTEAQFMDYAVSTTAYNLFMFC